MVARRILLLMGLVGWTSAQEPQTSGIAVGDASASSSRSSVERWQATAEDVDEDPSSWSQRFAEVVEATLNGLIDGLIDPLGIGSNQGRSDGTEAWRNGSGRHGNFDPASLPVPLDSAKEVGKLLNALVTYGQKGSGGRLKRIFDQRKLWEVVRTHARELSGDDRVIPEGVEAEVSPVVELLVRRVAGHVFDTFEVLDSRSTEDGSLELDTRLWNYQLETYSHHTLWIGEGDEGAGWLLYDILEASSGVQLSRLVLEALEPKSGRLIGRFGTIVSLLEQFEALDGEEVDYGRNLELKEDMESLLRSARLPSTFRRRLLADILALQFLNEEYRLSFNTIRELAAENLSVGGLAHYRLMAHFQLDNWGRVDQELRKIVNAYGWNSELYEYKSHSMFYQGERGKARRFARRGLDENPDHWGCIMAFAQASRKKQWPQVRELIENTQETHECYEWMISNLIDYGNYPLARELVEHMAADKPDCENLPYFREYLGMDGEG